MNANESTTILLKAARAEIDAAEVYIKSLRDRLAKAERALGQPSARAGLRVVRGLEDLRKRKGAA